MSGGRRQRAAVSHLVCPELRTHRMAAAAGVFGQCPLLLPQDQRGRVYDGFITAQEKDFRLRVILPTDLQLQNARLECSWQLKKVLQGYRHIVKQVHDRCMDIDILC
ncbi:E3 ubiquitin-protein ligase FANCL-like isoform X2 [Dendrobates tinctorius]|uniref:E3 ubiquitin-protein ligase FANCL-like isoform X2 n=1 Tax=Dendrobates tinctorius TaxID=92724 RepID=UPI003CC98FFE